jgi:hypothetical protein
VNAIEQRLLGRWISGETAEICTLQFSEGGLLDYTIHGSDKDQTILLTYRVEGDVLITDQPSHPREERTSFVLTEDDRLILTFGDHESMYVRAS